MSSHLSLYGTRISCVMPRPEKSGGEIGLTHTPVELGGLRFSMARPMPRKSVPSYTDRMLFKSAGYVRNLSMDSRPGVAARGFMLMHGLRSDPIC
jgi:hypothetical protein